MVQPNGPLLNDRKELLAKVAQVEEKIAYIEEWVSTKQSAPADFRDMKSKYMKQLDWLNARLAVREEDQDVPGLLDAGIANLLKLDYIFSNQFVADLRRLANLAIWKPKFSFSFSISWQCPIKVKEMLEANYIPFRASLRRSGRTNFESFRSPSSEEKVNWQELFRPISTLGILYYFLFWRRLKYDLIAIF